MRSARLELSLQAQKPPSCPAWCGPWPGLGAATSNRRLTDHPPRRLHTVVSAQGGGSRSPSSPRPKCMGTQTCGSSRIWGGKGHPQPLKRGHVAPLDL